MGLKLYEELGSYGTYYLLGTTHHAYAPLKAEYHVPSLFFEKAGVNCEHYKNNEPNDEAQRKASINP